MHTFTNGVFRAALFCAVAGLAACSTGNAHDAAFYADDPCDHDRSFCVYPVFEGSIHVDGQWHDGRYRYRFADSRNETREYWYGNSWHVADDARDASNGAVKKDD